MGEIDQESLVRRKNAHKNDFNHHYLVGQKEIPKEKKEKGYHNQREKLKHSCERRGPSNRHRG